MKINKKLREDYAKFLNRQAQNMEPRPDEDDWSWVVTLLVCLVMGIICVAVSVGLQ